MKKISILLIPIFLLISSCDFILKKDPKQAAPVLIPDAKVDLGAELDDFGCASTAGYRWSLLKKDCVRVFEIGFRLNPIDVDSANAEENELEDNEISCFIIYNDDKTQAELFLPNEKSGVVLTSEKRDNIYSNEHWVLDAKSGLNLMYRGVLKYAAAKTVELKVTGSDQIDDE